MHSHPPLCLHWCLFVQGIFYSLIGVSSVIRASRIKNQCYITLDCIISIIKLVDSYSQSVGSHC